MFGVIPQERINHLHTPNIKNKRINLKKEIGMGKIHVLKTQWILVAGLFFIIFSIKIKAANVIRNGSFEKGMTGWKTHFGGAKKISAEITEYKIDKTVYHDGTKSLKVINKKGHPEKYSLVISKQFPLKGEKPYSFKIAYKTKGVPLDKKNAIIIRMAVRRGNKALTKNYLWIKLPASEDWTVKEIKGKSYVTQEGVDKGFITIFFYGKGEFWLDGLSVKPEAVADKEKITMAGKVFFHKPRYLKKDIPLTNLSQKDKKNGYILYQRELRMVYPDSVPQSGERIRELRNFSTPGEYVAFYFSLHGLKKIKIIDCQVSDLTANKGKISKNLFKTKMLTFWKQRTNWRTPFYYIIPELLEEFKQTSIKKGKNQSFWLQLKLPPETKSGNYKANISITLESGEKVEIPVSLRVLPFLLKKPPTNWIMYSALHIPPQKHYSEEQKLRYLKDMKDYGINGFNQRVFVNIETRDGLVTKVTSPMIVEFQKLRKKLGMNGPWVINFGPMLEMQLIKKLSGKSDFTSYPYPGSDRADIKAAFIKVLKELDKLIKKNGQGGYDDWYYQGIDEPHCDDKMKQALWEYPLATKAGVKTFATIYPYNALSKLAPYLNVSCNSFIARNKKTLKKYLKLGKEKNVEYWLLAAGCYAGQEGGLMPNRYLCGFSFYKTGLPAHVFYAYQTFRGDPYNDFDAGAKDIGITYPPRKKAKKKISISTLQWEGIREGITDYKYIYTLKQYIKELAEKGYKREASDGERILDQILKSIPEGGTMYDAKMNKITTKSLDERFTNKKADNLRWKSASAIINLMKVAQ